MEPVSNEAINQEIKQVTDSLDKKLAQTQVLDLIRNNFFTIQFNNVDYKLQKPTGQQVNEMYDNLAKKKIEMLTDSDYLPLSVLKTKWKAKGIDIEALEQQVKDLNAEKEKIEYSLGKILEDNNTLDNPESFKKRIEEINKKISDLNNEYLKYIDISLENRLGIFQYSYLAYLITVKKVVENDKETWVKAFASYDDYLNYPSAFINKLNVYTVLMVKDEIESL